MDRRAILCLGLLAAMGLGAGCARLRGRNDDAITTELKAKMFSDPALKSANLNVTTKDGVVTLAGEVPDDATRLAAYKLATQTQGVSKVNDQMSVAAAQATPPPAMEPAPQPTPLAAPSRRTHRRSAKPGQGVASSGDSTPPPATAPAENVSQAEPPAAPAPPPPPQPITVTVPANTILTVRTIDSIDSAKNQAGQLFRASLDAPIVVDDKVIVPAGADAYVKLVNARSAGHISGRSELTLELASVVFQGKTYNLVASDVRKSGGSRGKSSAERIGGGAAIGALIGAIAGGGKGAAIGAAVGGGAGTGVQVFTKGQQVKIPAETRLDFTLQQPLDITYLPGRRASRRRPDRPPSAQPPADQPPNQLE